MQSQCEYRLAVIKGDVSKVIVMSKSMPELLETKFEHGFSALHLCAAHSDRDMAAALVQSGAFKEARDLQGHTPLQIAGLMCKSQLLNYLHENGSNVSSQNLKGETLCHMSTNTHHYAKLPHQKVRSEGSVLGIMELAVDLGCDLNLQNHIGQTPLHYAMSTLIGEGDSEFVRACLLLGSNTEIGDKNGETPLFYLGKAAEDLSLGADDLCEVLEILIGRGAKNTPNQQDVTPRMLFERSRYYKFRKIRGLVSALR